MHINNQEEILGLDLSDFETLNKRIELAYNFFKLWELQAIWLNSEFQWLNMVFQSLNREEVEEKMKEF